MKENHIKGLKEYSQFVIIIISIVVGAYFSSMLTHNCDIVSDIDLIGCDAMTQIIKESIVLSAIILVIASFVYGGIFVLFLTTYVQIQPALFVIHKSLLFFVKKEYKRLLPSLVNRVIAFQNKNKGFYFGKLSLFVVINYMFLPGIFLTRNFLRWYYLAYFLYVIWGIVYYSFMRRGKGKFWKC